MSSLKRRSHSLLAFALVGVVLCSSLATAQVAPEGGHHASVGGGTGLGAASSPTGGFSASVPLSLPTPPSSLPVPVSIQYSGPARDGDAGTGWEVPLSYVRRQASTWRRKPSLDPVNNGGSDERVLVSLNGASHLMVQHGDVRIPYAGSQYMELSRAGSGWTLKTLDNLEYRFTAAGSLFGNPAAYPDLWLLSSISDSSRADVVSSAKA